MAKKRGRKPLKKNNKKKNMESKLLNKLIKAETGLSRGKLNTLVDSAYRHALTNNRSKVVLQDLVSTGFIRNDNTLKKILLAKLKVFPTSTASLPYVLYNPTSKKLHVHKLRFTNLKDINSNFKLYRDATNFKNKTKASVSSVSARMRKFLESLK